MKKATLLSLLFLTIFAFGASEPANAQKNMRLNSTPKAFQVFYAKFRDAVVKREKNSVAPLTQFPFHYGFDAGDEGTYSKAQFIRHFADVFGTKRKIFAQKNPMFIFENGTYDLTDSYDASHYLFEKRGRDYKFTSYIAEP